MSLWRRNKTWKVYRILQRRELRDQDLSGSVLAEIRNFYKHDSKHCLILVNQSIHPEKKIQRKRTQLFQKTMNMIVGTICLDKG